MFKIMYLRLAMTNIRQNKTIYFPYMLANALVIAMYYILKSIRSMMQKAGTVKGSDTDMMLGFCAVVAVFMTFLILVYVNSFVLKQRKKEIGLYGILGLEKRHLIAMMFWEVAVTAGKGLFFGIFSGALLSQLVFLLFLKIIHIPSTLEFTVPLDSVLSTCGTFVVIYFILFCYNSISVWKMNPADMMKGAREGEREPKAKIALAVLGVAALAFGYGLALLANGPYETINVFLPAVLLVIAATYLLFLSGSIAFLKWMKKRERIYYKPGNFITISGMIYRMKQNAAGLATICILSTAVIVAISSSMSMYLGEEDNLRIRLPREYKTSYIMDDVTQTPDTLLRSLDKRAHETGVEIVNARGYAQCWLGAVYDDGKLRLSDEALGKEEDLFLFLALTQDDYNRMMGADLSLEEDETAVFTKGKIQLGDKLMLEDRTWEIKKTVENPETWNEVMYLTDNLVVAVMKDLDIVMEIRDMYNTQYADSTTGYRTVQYEYYFDLKGTSDAKNMFFEGLSDHLVEDVPRLLTVDSIDTARTDYYEQYGSIFFIGIFLSILFVTAVCLIIYYKQITEGYDDRERFHIMQKVGMSREEVKKAIRKQILQVFFLPLILAAIHMAVAFPALCRLLRVMNLVNLDLFAVCTVVTVLVFGCVYFVIYSLTSRTYYRLVTR